MNWWKKLKLRFQKPGLRDEATTTLSENTGNTVPQQAAAQQPRGPGFDCPRCSFRIATSMEVLLSGQPLFCKACGLKVSIDMEQSKACLDEVKKLNDVVKKVEKVKIDIGRKK